LVAVFVVGAFIAAIWSIVIYQNVYNSVIEFFPPSGPFHVALCIPGTGAESFNAVVAPSRLREVPLWVLRGLSLHFIIFFSIQQVVIGRLCLGVFFVSVFQRSNLGRPTKKIPIGQWPMTITKNHDFVIMPTKRAKSSRYLLAASVGGIFSLAQARDVAYWHKADVTVAPTDVRC
jgi:hypothetical protein